MGGLFEQLVKNKEHIHKIVLKSMSIIASQLCCAMPFLGSHRENTMYRELTHLFTGISNSAIYFKQKLMNFLSFSSPINCLILWDRTIKKI